MEKQALAGRYALGERVGTGGMADVFAALDTRLEREVAVKLFRPGTADGLERGSAEARLLAMLDHPGLVRVLDMDNGEHPGDSAYLVMELVRGPDLGVLLRSRGAMGREAVRLMALDLARTLQYIHGRGIVHRDIKPSNILTRQADPHSGLFGYLLTDFGIARFFDGGRMTATGQVIGSAAYFSPEQARGDGVGQPSDIYSLALVIIESLTGERAFPGTGIESALARLNRSPSIPHAAGPALSALLVAMTVDGPGDRPDAGGVVRALSAMGPQRDGDGPATTAPSDEPDTAALSIPPRPRPEVPSAGGDAATYRLERPSAYPTVGLGSPAAATSIIGGSGDLMHRPAGSARPVALDQSPPGGTTDPTGSAVPESSTRDIAEQQGSNASRPSGAVPRTRRRRIAWLVAVLVTVILAAGVWAFTMLSAGEASPGVEPLPSVPGETGEKLQELYESVK